jgi:hypothetical protein
MFCGDAPNTVAAELINAEFGCPIRNYLPWRLGPARSAAQLQFNGSIGTWAGWEGKLCADFFLGA